ncbi:hypothetical protein D8674_005320 [Pyrus ussuriensis x Pyrus communis]|uniref:Uncharacterized protein n=1 Tax=Pyrus ussuriensis x Pyrus communis TaxID=2448454 RepID=A0A5N5FRI2_9ROSA|nr:hypothetical protein D8674_005320 [Pyrus ussuriensis x Pyrus communis]
MAVTLRKRALANISQSLSKEACFCTSYERVQDPRNRPPTEAGRHGAKTTRKVTDTLVAEANENVVDTAEYRTIEDLSTFADQNDHHQKYHI